MVLIPNWGKKKKQGVIIGVVAIVFIGLAWVGYHKLRPALPELPDSHYYAELKDRAKAAKKVAKRHHLNTDYCLFVDYGIPSGTPHLFVWSFKQNQVVAITYVMHGPGKGSTAQKPVFSNKPGSKCSSLGRFVVTKEHGTKIKRSYRLKGLDTDNQSAFLRGLMIHQAKWVDIFSWKKHIPLNERACSGYVTVSSKGMDYLENLIKRENKRLLLWTYYSK